MDVDKGDRVLLSVFADEAALFLGKRGAKDDEIIRSEAGGILEQVGEWLIRGESSI